MVYRLFDHNEAVRMLQENPTITLQSVADHFGVSRERIRQIADRAGLNKRELGEKVKQRILECLDFCDDAEISASLNVPEDMVAKLRSKVSCKLKRDARDQKIMRAVDRVSRGESMRSVALSEGLSAMTVAKYCRRQKVETMHGRWGAMDYRRRYIRSCLEKITSRENLWPTFVSRLDFENIRTHLETVEGHAIKPRSLEIWVEKNIDKI